MKKIVLMLLPVILVSSGCALIPPGKIPVDRQNYLEAVSSSWKEQLLGNLVKLRYRDTLTFLELTSINTSYEFGGGLGGTTGFAWQSTGDPRHLLGLSPNVSILDKPSIGYSPIRGEALAKTLIKPLPLTSILRSLQTGWRADYIFSCCIESINKCRNRSATGKFEGDEQFFQVAQNFRILAREGIIRITIDEVKETTEEETAPPGKETTAVTNQPAKKTGKGKGKPKVAEEAAAAGKAAPGTKKVIKRESDTAIPYLFIDASLATGGKAKVNLNSFRALLGLEEGQSKFPIIDGSKYYPLTDLQSKDRPAVLTDEAQGKIVIQTRSIMEILTMLAWFIQIPPDHLNQRAERSGLSGQLLNAKNPRDLTEEECGIPFEIKSSEHRPEDPFVALKYRGHWFYIPDTDLYSKDVFSSTAAILSMSEPASKEGTPVYTLPLQ